MVNRLIFLFIGLIIFSNLVSAEIYLGLDIQDTFHQDQNIYFNYSFLSSEDVLIQYIPSIICWNNPSSLLQVINLNLSTFSLYEGRFDYTISDLNSIYEICIAQIQITSPEKYKQTISKNFTLISEPSFDFSLNINKKVFIVGEDILLDYGSSLKDPSISAILNFPDGTSYNIQLPHQFTAEAIGTYSLEATAIKEGYVTQTNRLSFGVYSENANIPPIESHSTNENFLKQNKVLGIIIGAFVVILFSILLYYYFLKRRTTQTESF
jgi:hypothetical protein